MLVFLFVDLGLFLVFFDFILIYNCTFLLVLFNKLPVILILLLLIFFHALSNHSLFLLLANTSPH